MCVDKIITLYHSNLFAGHQGVIKTYLSLMIGFYSKFDALFKIVYKRMSYLSTK